MDKNIKIRLPSTNKDLHFMRKGSAYANISDMILHILYRAGLKTTNYMIFSDHIYEIILSKKKKITIILNSCADCRGGSPDLGEKGLLCLTNRIKNLRIRRVSG